jgi:hypothetical protein
MLQVRMAVWLVRRQWVPGVFLAGGVRQLWVVDSALQLVYDDLVLLDVGVVVALVADAVVLVGGQVGAQLVDLLQGQALRDADLALLLPPLLVVQLDYAQVLELQLLLLAATAHLLLFLAVLFIVGIEVVLFVLLSEGVLFADALNIKIAEFENSPAQLGDLLEGLLTELGHFEVFLHLQLIISPQYVLEVISIRKGPIFLLCKIGLLLEVEGVDGLVDETVDVLLL